MEVPEISPRPVRFAGAGDQRHTPGAAEDAAEDAGEAREAGEDAAEFQGPVPSFGRSKPVIGPPGDGPGNWAGAPSVAGGGEGEMYLAYRLRHPIGFGRGYANVIARSVDGERFETVCVLEREEFASDSLERPALVRLPDGSWRVYVSCATLNSKHWRIDAIDAPSPERFDPAKRHTILPGNTREGLKDPVVVHDGSRWHMWVCAHPLDLEGAEDRMTTRYATSRDGIDWDLQGTALAPRPGRWDQRGTRVSAVLLGGGRVTAYYDGRASAAENAEERTGIASGESPDRLRPLGHQPLPGTPFGTGSLRYLSVLAGGDGSYRLFYETCRRDGAHDLRTEYVPFPRPVSQSL